MTSIADAIRGAPEPLAPSALSRYLREISVGAAYALLLIILAITHPDFFHARTGGNQGEFFSVLVNMSPILIAAIGMTIVIIARHIDISIGSQLAVCSVLAGLLAKSGFPMPVVGLMTVLAGAAMGAINGGLVAGLGLPSIVVTLATMVIFRESLRWLRQGRFVSDLPHGFQWFGLAQMAGQMVLLIVAAIVFGLFGFGMRFLAAGRTVYAVGSDLEAARLAGIRPRRVVFWVFVLMGGLVGLAALLSAVRSADVDPSVGTGWELTVIAAAVVGGAAITGGRATLAGTLIGVALLATIGPAMPFLGVPTQWGKAVRGAIILIAVASDGVLRRAD
jgi:ribose/xylose/arabinose/galactoside ABC-type transport system permease subunit